MTIAELADATGVSAHTLRYYEKMGLVPLVERDASSGHRRYRAGHAQWIAFLRNLARVGCPFATSAPTPDSWPRGTAPGPLGSRCSLLTALVSPPLSRHSKSIV